MVPSSLPESAAPENAPPVVDALPVSPPAAVPAGPVPVPLQVDAHHESEEVIQKLLAPDDLLNVWGWASSMASMAVAKTQDAVEKAKTISAPLISTVMQAATEPAPQSGPSVPTIVPLPWEVAPPEHVQDIRARILKLSSDDKTFLVPPPIEAGFVYSADDRAPSAQRLLETDPLLSAKRFKLVPKMVDEVGFWQNYFYRVELILGAMGVKEVPAATSGVQNSPVKSEPQHEGGEDWEEEMRKELAAVRNIEVNDDEENFDMLDDDVGEIFEDGEVENLERRVKEELKLGS